MATEVAEAADKKVEAPRPSPCPFCSWVVIEMAGNDWEETWRATCIGCLAQTGRYQTRSEAIEAWNNRAHAPNTRQRAERAARAWLTQTGLLTTDEFNQGVQQLAGIIAAELEK